MLDIKPSYSVTVDFPHLEQTDDHMECFLYVFQCIKSDLVNMLSNTTDVLDLDSNDLATNYHLTVKTTNSVHDWFAYSDVDEYISDDIINTTLPDLIRKVRYGFMRLNAIRNGMFTFTDYNINIADDNRSIIVRGYSSAKPAEINHVCY